MAISCLYIFNLSIYGLFLVYLWSIYGQFTVADLRPYCKRHMNRSEGAKKSWAPPEKQLRSANAESCDVHCKYRKTSFGWLTLSPTLICYNHFSSLLFVTTSTWVGGIKSVKFYWEVWSVAIWQLVLQWIFKIIDNKSCSMMCWCSL